MTYSVFVSSTRQDLIPYRNAVHRDLAKAGYAPIGMESFGARDQEPLEVCRQEVAGADCFVGIYAWRYGFVPRESAVSITEQELLEAQRRYKPIFCFIVDEQQEWPAAFREEGDGARKLDELKQRIRDMRVVKAFSKPEDLAASILTALKHWEEQQVPLDLSPEGRLQRKLLEKVDHFWMDRVLRKTVPEGRRLLIRRKERPDAVGRPAHTRSFADETTSEAIYDLFERQGRSLLILGPPGSGKTIALLELARGLAREARRDPKAAIPVVFNLASWKGQDPSLADWMARELVRRYQAGSEAAERWIEGDRVLPLLDGLDEVEEDCRRSCVNAINTHWQEHGLATGMAVACHTQVYEELHTLLRLETAVAMLPLTPAQVDERLTASGPSFAGLRAALAVNADLQELATLPLVFALLERTFQDAAPEDLPSGGGDDLIEQVFEAYVSHALESERELPWTWEERERPRGLFGRLPWNRYRPGLPPLLPPDVRYPPERTRRSLAWVAQGMAEHNRALFQVERLQPTWLSTRGQVFAYSLLSRILGGSLLALPLALAFGRPDFAGAGIVAGALVGALEITRLRLPVAARKAATASRILGRTFLLGGAVFLSLLLMGTLSKPSGGGTYHGHMLILTGLLFGLLFGVVFGVRGAGRGDDIRTAEALVWRGWSWRGTTIGVASLLLLSLVCWALFSLGTDRSVSYLDAGFWIPFSLIVAPLGGILFGAFGGLGGEALHKRDWPNLGTWLALRNAGVAALVTGLATVLALGLVIGALDIAGQLLEEHSIFPRGTILRIPLQVGLVLALWAGLAYSGLDFLQHFSLRLVLRLWKLVPGRLLGFLDHAVGRGLLQRPGGSYQFFHPLLRDWFAKRHKPPNRAPHSSANGPWGPADGP